MIRTQLLKDQGILIVEPRDRLQRADFERLSLLADPYIEEHGRLNGVLIDAESFPGWEDFGSLVSHIRFVRNHESQIRRVAAVTDNRFLIVLPRVAAHFAAAEVRHYHYEERDRALEWLRADRKAA